jgi:6-pyruvoyltetrahydropterin/6-carboxytetrahydropterin synthase
MSNFISTKVIELGSSAFRQWRATHSHCQYIHGYQLKAKFWFTCSKLDEKHWCADFGGLKPLKEALQAVFDHKLLVAADDPCLEDFKSLEQKGVVKLSIFPKGVGIERAAEYCFEVAQDFIHQTYGPRVQVSRVEVFEHEDNSAVYESCAKYEKYLSKVQSMIAEAISQPDENPQDGSVTGTMTSIEESPWGTPVTELTVTPHQPAQISQQVTSGRGNWFAGTSWQ